jgi:hypothetical protein
MFWKMSGKSKTEGIDSNQALTDLKEGLRNPNMSFIYHAHDHYFCPMGYEHTPSK